ncbi:MAG: putative Zn-dependent peptidase [Frankiales bacterium]|jgi:zinc protease|nr:putative Zn-dependent peptidase [Frankiales bacterium]
MPPAKKLAARPVPPLGKQRTPKLPTVGDTVLDNGLRVLAVRRPGVPLVELRLRVPFAAPTGKRGASHVARATLLSDTLLSGTEQRDAAQIAIDLQALGGQLSASSDADRLGFGGSVLTSGLPGFLDLLADLLTSASYPKREVEGERDRLVHELAIHRSSAGVVAREALLHRMYGDHPYGRDLPSAEDVQLVKAAQLRALHANRIVPEGSVLTLVGDLSPARATGLVAKALSGWSARGGVAPTPPAPPQGGRTALLVDRPGAVQTTIRFGGAAPSRTDPGYAAAALANLVFGGYFSSRWVSNIREDKGYTYSPHSGIDHPPAGSRLVAGADVATEVTAPALLETLYELGRIATVPVSQGELDQARRYAIGTLALSTASQAGLAGLLSQLAGAGLGVDWLRQHPAALERVTVEDVLEAGARWFAPSVLTPVLVGDTAVIEDSLRALVALETA